MKVGIREIVSVSLTAVCVYVTAANLNTQFGTDIVSLLGLILLGVFFSVSTFLDLCMFNFSLF